MNSGQDRAKAAWSTVVKISGFWPRLWMVNVIPRVWPSRSRCLRVWRRRGRPGHDGCHTREEHRVSERLRRAAVLVLEGAKPLDVGIPAQVFTTRASMPFEVHVCGPAPGLVTGGDGLSYHVAHGLDALETG